MLRENHLGDWGLPIAMVLHRLRENGTDLDALTLTDLDAAYREAAQAAPGGMPQGHRPSSRNVGSVLIGEQNWRSRSPVPMSNVRPQSETLVALQQGDEELVWSRPWANSSTAPCGPSTRPWIS